MKIRKTSRHICGWAIACALLSGMTQIADAALVSGAPYELLPLGDSNTRGPSSQPNSTAYRGDLQDLLLEGGYQMDFVGPNTNFDGGGTLLDKEHAGYAGYRIDQIDAEIATILGSPNTDPDVILLMIGTNDIYQNFDIGNAPARLNSLIGNIFGFAPGTHLFLSSIFPIAGAETEVDAFNSAIPGIVDSFLSEAGGGYNISFVDLHSLITLDYLADGLHPTAAGYAKAAGGWYGAIQSVTVIHTPLPSALFLFGAGISFLSVIAHSRRSTGDTASGGV